MSPGRAAFSAAWKSPPAPTDRIVPVVIGTVDVSIKVSGSCGDTATAGEGPQIKADAEITRNSSPTRRAYTENNPNSIVILPCGRPPYFLGPHWPSPFFGSPAIRPVA